MNTTLFIPKICKVGFNWREDCVSKKLGYIIGKDGKKWRKENSWNGWIEKPGDEKGGGHWIDGEWLDEKGKYGDEMKPFEFNNVPTEGFVLNKKVGGHSSGWNARQTYSRVFDPRGFEFEISVQNLLYILEYCNSIRGKALEGEFLYSWDGKDLVLLPANSPDYQASLDYKTLTAKKIGVKDLVEGCIYFDRNDLRYMYLGKRDYYSFKDDIRLARKLHIFYQFPWQQTYDNGYTHKHDGYFEAKNSLSFLKGKVSDVVDENYAEIFDKFQNSSDAAEVVDFEFTPVENGSIFDKVINRIEVFQKSATKIIQCSLNYYPYGQGWGHNKQPIINIEHISEFDINEKTLASNYSTSGISQERFNNEKFYKLTAIYSNGFKKEIDRLYNI